MCSRYWENVGGSLEERVGAASPFHGLDIPATWQRNIYAAPEDNALFPALVDFDHDGDTDLVLGTASGELRYFEQVQPPGWG